jgi:alpha-glucoside transport system substrate-binding protein
MSRKFSWVLSLLVVAALALAACGGGSSDEPEAPAATEAPAPTEAPAEPTEAPAEEAEAEATEAPAEEAEAEATEAPAEEAAAPGELSLPEVAADTLLGRALAGEFSGTTVSMFGPFTDEDAVKFNTSIAAFEEATGIDIQYEGSKEFETTISVRVDAGDPPDIADFPQPGLLANLVASGAVVDASTFLNAEQLAANYNQSWLDMAMMEGPDGPIMAGVWHRFNGKSIVWYPKDDFDAAGYTIPTTWDELMELTETIASDGDTPWCIGIESGTATGWPATDWIEEIMLRTTSLENYDAWTSGELPFSSPEVTAAVETMAEIWTNDAYVYGGRGAIVSTFFGDAPAPMFEDPPRCWLHKQGNFITSFFPADAQAGVDFDFFYLPSIDDAYGKPFLIAGDLMAAFTDRPEVQAVMEYFTYGDSVKGWLAAGGALSPHNDASLDWYGNDVERGVAQLVQESTSFRFDGSDLMPGEVGAGSFWKGMTDYIAGTVDLPTALEEIDAAWPR